MDVASKRLASQSGLDRKDYAGICEDIDWRYRLQYDGLDFAKATKGDDPMGLSNIFEGSPESVSREAASHPADEVGRTETQQQPQQQQQQQPAGWDLDAMRKGKGKGKYNDGKCNTCRGNYHDSRDCLSSHPLTDVVCNGCEVEGGKGWGGNEGGKGGDKG